jgi:DNA-binding NarL/FixJ family response regulator
LGIEADDYLMRALRAGASGFLLKDTPPTELVRGVRGRRRRTREQLDLLTEREREVAVAIATVKAHVSRVLEKLAINNRVQIALLVHEAGEL